jgi:hypothetical protein
MLYSTSRPITPSMPEAVAFAIGISLLWTLSNSV